MFYSFDLKEEKMLLRKKDLSDKYVSLHSACRFKALTITTSNLF